MTLYGDKLPKGLVLPEIEGKGNDYSFLEERAMASKPDIPVSIVLPVYNRIDMLRRTMAMLTSPLQSVFLWKRWLSQAYFFRCRPVQREFYSLGGRRQRIRVQSNERGLLFHPSLGRIGASPRTSGRQRIC